MDLNKKELYLSYLSIAVKLIKQNKIYTSETDEEKQGEMNAKDEEAITKLVNFEKDKIKVLLLFVEEMHTQTKIDDEKGHGKPEAHKFENWVNNLSLFL